MNYFYSKKHGGICCTEITAMDEGDTLLSEEQHAELLTGQAAGKVIVMVDGKPALQDAPAPTPPTQFEKDEQMIAKRLAKVNELLAWMAAGNLARMNDGTWPIASVIQLNIDLVPINSLIQCGSFELAMSEIEKSTNELLTKKIKDSWKAKLAENLFKS